MLFDDLFTVLTEIARHSDDKAHPPTMVSKAAGQTIILAGEEGENMFVIQAGDAEILSDGVVFDVVGPGGIIGEMALVDGSFRSATVRARSALRLMPISKPDFEALTRHHPEFGLYVMKIMSLRLRLMNARLGNAIEDISYREKIEHELRAMATRDPLTGISNRRHISEAATREIEQAQRHGRKLSVAMIDIDHFKAINDTFGHACGDNVLRLVVEVMADELRSADTLGRMGGEEFAAILPETGLDTGSTIAERIRARIAEHVFIWDGKEFGITASIGIAAWNTGEVTIDPTLVRADKALYTAKDQGRNCVVRQQN
ncbi:MAG: GGDEF domain-containing protein [Magnetovibrio sp.]|nr:GGDEF domain-containing protein [Magnetovibrio sp.]